REPPAVVLGEALTAEEQAVEIYRRLAADNPAAHEPDLAGSLTNLGLHLGARGDLPGTLRATGEAAELYRCHVAAMPPILLRLHAVLRFRAVVLDALGRGKDAEAIRRWLRENPLPPDSHN
ncbi:hypothetical protein RKE29_25890, partial [Streptomyces sp. B1866]|nr:hypothetical protein [Streptomyces sp. B1866]